MDFVPVVLFVYNRLSHTKKTIESLEKNNLAKETELFIFSDNHKVSANEEEVRKVREVREYIRTIDGFKKINIIEAKENKGLANSVIEGITQIINVYGKVIVLEDDLVVSEYFLSFINNALNVFEKNKEIWSISGYTPPINFEGYTDDLYIIKRGCSWGWATWKDRWETINWSNEFYKNALSDRSIRKSFNQTGYDMSIMLEFQLKGQIDSWAIRWCYNQFIQDKYTVYPVKSFVQNIGTDNSGTHSGNTNKYNVKISNINQLIIKDNISENKKIVKRFRRFYSPVIKIVISKTFRRMGIYKIIRKLAYK